MVAGAKLSLDLSLVALRWEERERVGWGGGLCVFLWLLWCWLWCCWTEGGEEGGQFVVFVFLFLLWFWVDVIVCVDFEVFVNVVDFVGVWFCV